MSRFLDLVFAIGIVLPFVVHAAALLALIPRRAVRWFWLGAIVGATWEIPLFALGPVLNAAPLVLQSQAFPVHPALQPLVFSFVDGGLFLCGMGWLHLLPKGWRGLGQLDARALAVLLVWGLLVSIGREFLLADLGVIRVTPQPFNPVVTEVSGVAITAAPHLLAAVMAVLYYLLVFRDRRLNGPQPAVFRW
ncbi:MAG: hypothetical protein KTR31_25360 [Myxococcales bacterium]|nr:hypothetical protein [Myxococcales bacterium]